MNSWQRQKVCTALIVGVKQITGIAFLRNISNCYRSTLRNIPEELQLHQYGRHNLQHRQANVFFL